MRRLAAALALFALLAAGCAPATFPAEQTNTDDDSITVGAAADLYSAFIDLRERYQAETGRKVLLSFAASGQLARQIENGAPIDLFAAASPDFVNQLKQKGLIIPDTEKSYAIGQLVLAVNKASGARVTDLKELLDPQIKRVAIANPAHAPYGAAAREALMAAGLWEKLQPKLVYGESILQTTQFVQTGNAEAGILARTRAELPELRFTAVPAELYQPLTQTLAVVKGTRNEAAARAFAAYVTGPEGRAVLETYGYSLPEEP